VLMSAAGTFAEEHWISRRRRSRIIRSSCSGIFRRGADTVPPRRVEGVRSFGFWTVGGALVLLAGRTVLGFAILNEYPLKELLPRALDSKTEYREGKFPVGDHETGCNHIRVFGRVVRRTQRLAAVSTMHNHDGRRSERRRLLVQANTGDSAESARGDLCGSGRGAWLR